MQAVTLERWIPPGADTADPSSGADDTEEVPYAFTWTDTGDPADLEPYAFEWDDAVEDAAAPNAKSVASGAGAGAAVGGAVGTIFPGIGTALGAGIGGAVGAIGGFVSGLFGGKKKKRRRKPRKKPTPKWVVAVLEEARRGLLEVPPNPSKSIDAVLVVSGHMSRDGYMMAKQMGQLPSQIYDQNRSAAALKGGLVHQKVGTKIARSLAGLKPGEKALVSAAIPLGKSKLVLGAIKKIRSTVSDAHAERAGPTKFSPEVLQALAREFARGEPAPTGPIQPPPQGEESGPEEPTAAWGEGEPGDHDTSGPAEAAPEPAMEGGPTGIARDPTIDDLPRPVWHISPPVMPRHVFERLLRSTPELAKLPKHVLRAIAGKAPRAQDTAGVDPVMRQYVMLPGETFAGIARNLTGDPNREVELHAANPKHNPARMRVEIPPGWLEYTPLLMNDAPETGAPKTPAKGPGSGSSPPAPKAKRAGKDGPRANTTRRVIQVLAGDWPMKIATRTGAKDADPQWWKTLKSANPHKVVGSNGNWETLFPGETLNYPDSWPQHPEAKPAVSERTATAPETPLTPDDPLGPDPPPPPPPKAAPPAGKNGPRPALTKRVIEVLRNDWPEKIATRVGAKAMDPQWWRTLKGVNPHKAVASNGNWETLFAGETLNYPDTWPAHLEAKPAPELPTSPVTPTPPGTPAPPNPAPQQPIPAGGTADWATTWWAQCVLIEWTKRHPDRANPRDYGSVPITEVTGTMTNRTTTCLAAFQTWWNAMSKFPVVRTDGVIDTSTRDALQTYQVEMVSEPIPQQPGGQPLPQIPQGGGSPVPPGIPGGSPVPPGTPIPAPPPPPPPPPPPSTREASGKDDDAAMLVIGGTMLSLLMR